MRLNKTPKRERNDKAAAKEKKRKLEAWKHIHLPGCRKSR